MRLSEALQINQRKPLPGAKTRKAHLVCGLTPLHLESFIRAQCGKKFPEDEIEIITGLFGDIEGNLQRSREIAADGAIVVMEWSDFDDRLGIRASGGWSNLVRTDILEQSSTKATRIGNSIPALALKMPVTLVAPTLQLPPIGHTHPAQISQFELQLQMILIKLLGRCGESSKISVVNDAEIARLSPASGRRDTKMELHAGFPYTISHASIVAEMAVERLFPKAPKKGLITDLDNTVWKGILGDDGPSGISWSLEEHSQAYALYQQELASLAESGVLVAVASKNDSPLVQEAFSRADILLKEDQVFPVEANWGPKSESVSRILKAWNIAADSVVFVDDSPMELAEVGAKHPDIECLQFPSEPQAGILDLLRTLRARFGKACVREEDRIRMQSIRSISTASQLEDLDGTEFQSSLNAKLTLGFSPDARDGRALELVNKTNQFNLNGRRFTEGEWDNYFAQKGAFLITISYEDRFGPLGKIGVLGGTRNDEGLNVDIWVMSCRAFSRQIEFQIIQKLFEGSERGLIAFSFRPTPKNGPLQQFFRLFFPQGLPENDLELRSSVFSEHCPQLFHQVIESSNGQLVEQAT